MSPTGLGVLAALALVPCLFLIPLGLPGTWIMLAILLGGVGLDLVGLGVWAALVVVAGLAELAELLIVRRTSARYGGSRGAFWGAILGGFAGVVVGLPVPAPLVGPLLGGLLGTFAGAAAVTLWQTRQLRSARRVGWGVLVGRALAAAAKTAAGLVVLVVGGAALVF